MNAFRVWHELDAAAKRTFTAAFLGWTLDAFDFFLVTFVITQLAHDFARSIPEIAFAVTLTLMFRPLGALIFGWLGDRFGRRRPLMVDIALFGILELATAFSPNFTIFLVLRALFGIAMGGEWGLGAAMAMESLPPKRRGLFSGILQEGYMVGYLLAALAFYLVATFTPWGWRGLFVIGAIPAVFVLYIRSAVPESRIWKDRISTRITSRAMLASFWRNAPLVIYTMLFMAGFNFLSHGTQDLYATFLQKQHGFAPAITSSIGIIAAFGAIAGGIVAGAVSQRMGRRMTILVATVIGILVVPLWAYSQTILALAVGGFAMQFAVQGAWGVIPAHLNELSPGDLRGTFPGFTYQIGNLISAGALQIEATIAKTYFALPSGEPDYAKAMAVIATSVLIIVGLLTLLGFAVKPELRNADFAESSA